MNHDVTVAMLVSETKAPEIVLFYHANIALFPSLNTTADQMNDNTNCIITQSGSGASEYCICTVRTSFCDKVSRGNDTRRYEANMDSWRWIRELAKLSFFLLFAFCATFSSSLSLWSSCSSCARVSLWICLLSFLDVSLVASMSLPAISEKEAWRCMRRDVVLNIGFADWKTEKQNGIYRI